jgi:Ferredoxin-like domain in Api92-like protein
MPNWITNCITAPKHVIQAMLNEQGKVDFNTMAPFPGPQGADWNGIYGDAETAAEFVCGKALSNHPLLASLEAANRRDFDIKKLSAESFNQFVGMLENYRACGYLHPMDFARQVWGTKWNACEPTANPDEGTASFDTAWACPEGVLLELSKRFPDDPIEIVFADEDIGSNCGKFTLKAGKTVASDIAPAWRNMTDDEKAKWKAFAYEVKGWTPDEDENDD